ncbi:M20/M25/M40 family metallo-hydrolase [Desulfovibrio ferrophilus]|uniref:Aminopeptidase n=1 Tax=Desulfovibrio ferrophilus TaxID=241368 RepID=A0A2Z6AYB5_9BACT|nr:M20/M25/M40 family metallo-hydrolase [Desulfovibrio ferrophilus]BBD08239.1 aminopeptidase [Desulfovibrio ferrophilus]
MHHAQPHLHSFVTSTITAGFRIALLLGALFLTLPRPLWAGQHWDKPAVTANLKAHVMALASDIGERNMDAPDNYQRASAYITGQLTAAGVSFEHLRPIPDYPSPPIIVANFGPNSVSTPTNFASSPRKAAPTPNTAGATNNTSSRIGPALLLCAHYDTVPEAPGANDNASGVAVLLELARLLKASPPRTDVQIAFFPNEEEPYFMTPASGSVQYAQHLSRQGALPDRVVAVDSVGWTGKDAGWRTFLRFSGGNLTVGARPADRALAETLTMALNNATDTEAVVTKDGAFWIDKSDHAPFAAQGCEAVLLTAPGTLAYPCLHKPCDTAEKLDYNTMERTVSGLLEFTTQHPSNPR